MTYEDTLRLIKEKEKLGTKPGLENIKKALNIFDNPQNKIKTLHIAGTNGKGTVASSLANSLSAAGFRTGLFTSPWVIDYREQIQIDGNYISKQDISNLFEGIDKQYKNLTEFELLTVCAFEYFYINSVDYAVIECGMGGSLDSTNVISSPLLSIITEVSLDHTDFLGKTIYEIAENKAGIIKKNGTAVIYPNEKLMDLFEKKARENNASIKSVPDLGSFEKNNYETVRLCLQSLNLSIPVLPASLPARHEMISDHILLDGSHNLSSVRALEYFVNKNHIDNAFAVISMMHDKDTESYIKTISNFCSEICVCRASNKRTEDVSVLYNTAKKYCERVIKRTDPKEAFNAALKSNKFVIVCGSFYLARDLRKYIIDITDII